jgi:TatD DNase family protein
MLMELVDTHAHLDDERLISSLEDYLAKARDAGVIAVITVGTTAASSEQSVRLAERYDLVSAAVGIQPNCCGDVQPDDWPRVVKLVDQPRVVALGETGLDRHWDDAPFDVQQDYFDRHLRLSQKTNLPFIVHMRDCQSDVLDMLREARQHGPLRGVMHSFTGDSDGAQECAQMGMHISFAGMVTYKKSDELRDVARQVPEDRILIETDSPYLSPHPHRSVRPNHPAMIRYTAECLAEVRGVSVSDIAKITRRNAKNLFGV